MVCSSICPNHAISVTYSEFGYRLPIIDRNLCINCGLCEKVCQSKISLPAYVIGDAYIAFNSNKELCLKSASGGVFSCLAKSFIEEGGVVAGAYLSFEGDDIAVKHIIVKNADDLSLILGSKYVESDCSGIYNEIEKYLKSGISVLFCGTSCQVKALYGYLEIQHISIEKLFTIDLICHGVPGIQFFKDYLNYVGFKTTANSELAFRSKDDGVIRYKFSWKARPEDSTVINIPASNSSYYDLFLHSDSYRKQCYQCEYASDHKPGDITIGDYFEAKDDYPDLFSSDGPLFASKYLNCLLVNSEKGQRLIEIFGKGLIKYPVSRKRVQLSHSNLCKPSTYGKLRLDTIDKYQSHGIAGVEKMYRKIFAANSAITKIKKIGSL